MADAGAGVNWPAVSNFGATIAGLPTDYYKALENGYNQRNRDLFVNGLPTDAGGNTDYGQMFKKVLEAGGAPGIERASHALQLGISAQAPQANADAVRFLANPSGNNGPGVNMPSTQVPSITPNGAGAAQPQSMPSVQNVAPRTAAQAQPRGGVAGDNGNNTMMSYITSKVGPENAGYVAATIKGTDPNAPMPPGYEVAADRAIAAWQNKNGAQPQAPQQQQAQQPQPPRQSLAEEYQLPTAPAAAPGAAPPDPTLGGLVPNGWNPTQYLAALQTRAANPSLSAPVLKSYQTKIEAIQKVLQQRAELTPEQKNAGAANMPILDYAAAHSQTEARGKESGTAFAKRYETIQETGAKAAQEIPQLEYAEKLMQDPNFYSGIGEPYNMALKRIAVALGGDPSLAGPQEAFRKVVSNSILQSLGQLRGLGQIRVAEINLAKEAAASLSNTPVANHILLTVAQRLNKRAADIAELAQGYRGGNLDSGFDHVIATYDKRNPVFSPDEIQNWRSVVTQIPAGKQAAGQQGGQIPRVQSQEEAVRLGSGKQFFDPNGVLRRVP